MMDWLIVWGVTQAVGFTFKPILEDLAKDATKDWAKDLLKGCINNAIQLPKKEPLEIAAGKALKEFLLLVQQQLETADISEQDLEKYNYPLKQFIKHKLVQDVLGSAFKEDCLSLDYEKLENTWNLLKLLPLPDDFNWKVVSKLYLNKVKAIIRESEDLRSILDSQTLEAIKQNTKELAGITPNFDLQAYQIAIKERYENLKLDTLDTTGYAYNEMKLWKIFIVQNVRKICEFLPHFHEIPKEYQKRLRDNNQLEGFNSEDLEYHKQVYFEQPTRPILEIINDRENYKYIVFLGDPGSGKSTLLQFLAIAWAESPLSNVISQPIPLLIELRSYIRNRNEGHCKNFLEFFHQCSGAIHHFNQHQLYEHLKVGNALVMFDGLDEVFEPGNKEDIINDIHRFTNEYPNVQVIVTSRIIGYKPQRLRDVGFIHFVLQDLEIEQIYEFISRWHNLTFNNELDKLKKRERLKKAIDRSKSIRELAGNPLLLTMMAILNRNQELPRDRSELYNQASKVLLHQWDIERALVEDNKLDIKTIDYRDKQAMLRHTAYYMQANVKGFAGNFISAFDLENILTKYLISIDFDKPRAVAKLIINQLRVRNFILCFMGADYYAFVHRTFLEFFCAWELVWQFKEAQTLSLEQIKIDVFGKHWYDESWHEVLRLIVGMVEPKFAGEIIEYLIEQNGIKEGFTNLFLAAECLLDIRNRSSVGKIFKRLLKHLKVLSTYREIEVSEKSASYSGLICIKAISTIVETWKDDPETLPWLKLLIKSNEYESENEPLRSEYEMVRGKAIQELAKGWKDEPETLPLLKSLALSDVNDWVRGKAIQELAKGWKDDPDILPMLKSILISNKNQKKPTGLIGVIAIESLVEVWKDDPDTLPILKSIALSDVDDFICGKAIEELAKIGKHDPDIFPMLKSIVLSDVNYWTRVRAIEQLVKSWKDDPDILPMLKSIALSHENEWVRATAIEELVKGWKDDPDILPMLKSIALSHENGWMQRTAVLALANNWKDNPDTLTIVKESIHPDKDEYLRRAGISVLVSNWKDEPDTLPLLKSIAQSDKDSKLQEKVILALADDWKDDPDTLPLLKSIAQSAKDSEVRQTAILTLANNWKNDTATLPLLQSIVQSDDSEYVRQAVVQELAKGWRDEPGMFEFLCDLIVNKPCLSKKRWETSPRRVSIEVILKQYLEHPQILPLLRDRAENDLDEQVRKFAKCKLAELDN